MNHRRKLLVALGAGALAAPLATLGQQRPAGVPRVGFLGLDPLESSPALKAFREGLRERGYAEGVNIRLEIRAAGDRYDLLPGFARELVGLKVDVIVTSGSTATRAASQATATIPIVIGFASVDPVAAGYAASLARPGRNITGVVSLARDLTGKRLELLKEVVPGVSSIGLLLNPDSGAGAGSVMGVQAAARILNLQIHTAEVRALEDFERAFVSMTKARVGALFVLPSSMLLMHATQIAELAARHRLPAMYQRAEYVEAGGLMSYGSDFFDGYRRVSDYVDRILKGARPGDLPIQQPTKFELVINMKTAKALGIKIPNSILVRANKVIE